MEPVDFLWDPEGSTRVSEVFEIDGSPFVKVFLADVGFVAVLSVTEAHALATSLGQVLLDHALAEAGAVPTGPEPVSSFEMAELRGELDAF